MCVLGEGGQCEPSGVQFVSWGRGGSNVNRPGYSVCPGGGGGGGGEQCEPSRVLQGNRCVSWRECLGTQRDKNCCHHINPI